MDIKTVFGVTWHIVSYPEVTFFIFVLIAFIALFLVVRYLQKMKDLKIQDHQLFLFRLKRLGLSNFQIKILTNMTGVLHLAQPAALFKKPELFEFATGRLLKFLRDKENGENEDLASICRELSLIYDKLYHAGKYKKPIQQIEDIEVNQLLYFIAGEDDIYFGKLISTILEKKVFSIQMFRSERDLRRLLPGLNITVYVWQTGDAEYRFSSQINNRNGKHIEIEIPEAFTREKELRHPYIDVIIPSKIKIPEGGSTDKRMEYEGTLLKINNYEAVVRLGHELTFQKEFEIEFEIMEFELIASIRVMAHRTHTEGRFYYYTFKFDSMSDPARKVLKTYVYEHL